MLGRRCRDARGRCPGCSGGSGGAHRLSRGLSGGCRGLAGPAPPSGCAPRAPLRAPRRGWRSGGAGGRRRGGEGVVSPARLSRRPGSINEIIMQMKQPCATRQPYLIPAGGEVGQGGPWAPVPRGAGTGPAVPVCLAFPVRRHCRHPRQPDTREGHGWARPTACARSIPGGAASSSLPGHPGGPVPSRSRSARVGARGQDCAWAGDRAWKAPGERVGTGVARGGTRGKPCIQTHTRRSGNIKLHCR